MWVVMDWYWYGVACRGNEGVVRGGVVVMVVETKGDRNESEE